jgi:hypothetical protein
MNKFFRLLRPDLSGLAMTGDCLFFSVIPVQTGIQIFPLSEGVRGRFYQQFPLYEGVRGRFYQQFQTTLPSGGLISTKLSTSTEPAICRLPQWGISTHYRFKGAQMFLSCKNFRICSSAHKKSNEHSTICYEHLLFISNLL